MLKKKTLTQTLIISLCINVIFIGCKSASSLLHKVVEPQSYKYQVSSALKECQLHKTQQGILEIQIDSLQNLELGLLNYFKYKHKEANTYLSKAIQIYRQNETKAVFDFSSFLKREYRVESYDKVLLHNYKALNYLILGDSQAARVESKNSNMIQDFERKKVKKFKNENSNNNSNKILLSKYDKLFMNVNPKHNPYQNPFAYYISALSYAEDKDFDNAIIDIRHALSFLPHSNILKEKLKIFRKKQFPKQVELFFDVGQSPLKSQVALKVDMGNDNQRVIYFPSFILEISDIEKIKLVNNKGITVAESSILADINAIKINDFKEKLPAVLSLITEQVSISLASGALTQKSELIASFLKTGSAIYTQTNRRTWALLPQKILVLSFSPQKNESYTMQLISKDEVVIEEKTLDLKSKNKYKHFTIRNGKFCTKK